MVRASWIWNDDRPSDQTTDRDSTRIATLDTQQPSRIAVIVTLVLGMASAGSMFKIIYVPNLNRAPARAVAITRM